MIDDFAPHSVQPIFQRWIGSRIVKAGMMAIDLSRLESPNWADADKASWHLTNFS